MNFDLSDDRRMMVETARTFVHKRSPVDRMRRLRWHEVGFERDVWRQMGELGWLGILFPEDLGGIGGRFIDAALLLEILGESLVPEPYIAAVILGGTTLLRAGSKEQQARWLPALIAGEVTLALAYAEEGSRFDLDAVTTTAERRGGSYRLRGEKSFVPNGHAADLVLVSARTEAGLTLFAVPAGAGGLSVSSIKTMDGHRAAMLRLEDVEVPADHRLGDEGAALAVLQHSLDWAAAAACAEGLGICQRVLDMTVEYLKTREQFGVAIGSFQVLQHRAVDMFIEVELCRSMAILAALAAEDPDIGERQRSISAALVQLSSGGRFVVRQGIQLHGGIGCTDEHDIGLYFKRMQVLTTLFGDADYHLGRYASLPSFAAEVADLAPPPAAARR